MIKHSRFPYSLLRKKSAPRARLTKVELKGGPFGGQFWSTKSVGLNRTTAVFSASGYTGRYIVGKWQDEVIK